MTEKKVEMMKRLLNYLGVDFYLHKIFTVSLFTKRCEEHSVSEEYIWDSIWHTMGVKNKKGHFQTKILKMTKFTFDPYIQTIPLDIVWRVCLFTSFSGLLTSFVRSVTSLSLGTKKVDVSEDCLPFETKYTKLLFTVCKLSKFHCLWVFVCVSERNVHFL